MHRPSARERRGPSGPTQRQLRAGELVRHALVDILRHETFVDPALAFLERHGARVEFGRPVRGLTDCRTAAAAAVRLVCATQWHPPAPR